MAHNDEVFKSVKQMVIFDLKPAVKVMADKNFWKTEKSIYQNTVKSLNANVQLGRLVKEYNHYKIPGCNSDWNNPHVKELTYCLAEILKLPFEATVFREHHVEPLGLRPDGLILLTHEGKGRCFILEVCLNETESYLRQKQTAWEHWPQATEYLSNLFKVKVPHFDFVATKALKDAFLFQDYLTLVQEDLS